MFGNSTGVGGVGGGVVPDAFVRIISREISKEKKKTRLTRTIFANGTPVATRKQSFVISALPVHIMSKNRNHILVRIGIQMVDLVPFVEKICQHFRGWCVYNRGGYNIGHIAIVLVFGYPESRVRIELPNCCQVNIAPSITSVVRMMLCQNEEERLRTQESSRGRTFQPRGLEGLQSRASFLSCGA